MEQKILQLIKDLPKQQQIDAVERVGKYLRRKNSADINNKQYNRAIVEERPDESLMKS